MFDAKKYREENKERCNALNRAWYQKNKEHHKKKEQARRLANPEKFAKKNRDAKKRFAALNPNYDSEYYLKHKDLLNEYDRKWTQRVRLEVMTHLCDGKPKCQCCGIDYLKFLAIDHINGDGAEHRRKYKGGSLPYWIKKNNYPDGFQVLCHNCNFAKQQDLVCPCKEEYQK